MATIEVELVSRAAWGARRPRGSYERVGSPRGVKVHYTGGRVDPAIVDDHDRCVAMVRSIQNYHMDGNGWIDIAYSMVACPHRKVFVGRGPHHLPAANGAGLNTGHYAVLGLVGASGLVQPPDLLLHGIRDAIDYLRAEGGAGREIKGHRDGYPTDCPGDHLYAWVLAGAPRPKDTSWTEDIMRSLPMLGLGDISWDVKTIRWLLGARGYPPQDAATLSATAFDDQLDRDVRGFQRAEGLMVDGIVGQQTWSALMRV